MKSDAFSYFRFGLPHDSVCNEEPCDKNGKTIMNSPGSDGAYWSKWSKSLIDRQFSDKLSYTCLKWKCGSYSPDPDTVFAHPEDVKALDAECEYNGAGIKLDKMKTAIEYKDFIEHFRLKTSDYYKVWKSNPEWVSNHLRNIYSQVVDIIIFDFTFFQYKYANICKGYPCKDPTRGALVGFSAEDVDGYPCGAGKVSSVIVSFLLHEKIANYCNFARSSQNNFPKWKILIYEVNRNLFILEISLTK